MGYFKVSYLVGAVLCWSGPMTRDAAESTARLMIAERYKGVEVKFFSA